MNIQTKNFGEVELINFTELSESDVHYVLEMRNHPEIKKWMYNQEDITEAQHLSFIKELRTDNSRQYYLVRREDLIIGVVYFTEIDYCNKRLCLGLYANRLQNLEKAGSTMMEVVLAHIRSNTNYKTINIEVFSSNKVAINLYNKFGFVEEAEKEVNGYPVYQMKKNLTVC